MVDDQGVIVAANAEICRLFAYEKQELIGASLEMLVPERLRAGHLLHRQGYRATPKTCRMGPGVELYGLRRGGAEFPIEVDLHPIDSPDGLRVLALIRDATEEKHVRDGLKASLQEKDSLLRELHHRVHNNMQTLSSLLNVQKQGLDESGQDVIEYAREQLRAMSLVHRALQRSDDITHVDLADYLTSLISDTKQAHGARGRFVHIDTQLASVNVRFDFAFIAGRIVHEAVLNSLKHGFDDATGGTVTVGLSRRDHSELELSIVDNGKGLLPPEFASARTGLGLELIAQLVKQAGGTLDIRSGPGLAIVVRFKHTDSTGEGAP